MKDSLIEICDEIFMSQHLPIYSRVKMSKQLFFFDFPRSGLMLIIEDLPAQGNMRVHSKEGETLSQWGFDYELTTENVEDALRRIYEEFADYLDQSSPYDRKPRHKPEITLKIDRNTPTAVLETLAAMALGWELRDYGYWVSKEGFIQMTRSEWTPITSSDQTLQLATKLDLKLGGNSPAEIRFNITLAAAQKYVQGA